MQDIIQIDKASINGSEVNSVNSRDIHNHIKSKQDYSTWIKKRLNEIGSVENKDFITLHKKMGRQTLIDYIVTTDTAKHLGMMERNEKGKEIRDYFIEIEKETNKPLLPQNYIEALEALTQAEKDKLALTTTIKEKDKVIVAVADLNIRAGNVSIGDFSKNLAIEGLGRNNLFSWLKGRGFLMMNTEPYQPYVTRGYFVRKPSEKRVNGEVKYTTMLTPKGTVWLTKILHAEFGLDDE